MTYYLYETFKRVLCVDFCKSIKNQISVEFRKIFYPHNELIQYGCSDIFGIFMLKRLKHSDYG